MSDCHCARAKELAAELVGVKLERDSWKRAAMERYNESAKFEQKAISLERKLAELTAMIERREVELESYKTQLENMKDEYGC